MREDIIIALRSALNMWRIVAEVKLECRPAGDRPVELTGHENLDRFHLCFGPRHLALRASNFTPPRSITTPTLSRNSRKTLMISDKNLII